MRGVGKISSNGLLRGQMSICYESAPYVLACRRGRGSKAGCAPVGHCWMVLIGSLICILLYYVKESPVVHTGLVWRRDKFSSSISCAGFQSVIEGPSDQAVKNSTNRGIDENCSVEALVSCNEGFPCYCSTRGKKNVV